MGPNCLKERSGLKPREGVIIECPLNELYHDIVTIILTSQMVVSKIFLTVVVS